MLEQYKKTFKNIQFVIALLTGGALIGTQRLDVAAASFLVMQVGAILGAAWGSIIRRRQAILMQR